MAYLSLKLGQGDPKSAAAGVGNAITSSFIVGIVLCALFNIFLEPLCVLFGATKDNLPYAMDYDYGVKNLSEDSCQCRSLYSPIKNENKDRVKKLLMRVGSLGISSFITQIAIVLVMAVTNNVLVSYGANSVYGADIPLTTIGITMKVNQIITAGPAILYLGLPSARIMPDIVESIAENNIPNVMILP